VGLVGTARARDVSCMVGHLGEDPAPWAMPPMLEDLLHGVALLLWDFDGVIADTEPVQEYSYATVLSSFGIVPDPEFFSLLLGKSEPEIWASLLEQHHLPVAIRELIAMRADIYLPRAMLTIEPSRFVRPILEYCHLRGILNVIVSSGGFVNISRLLAHWRLRESFADIYCRESPYHNDLATKPERLRHAVECYLGPAAIIEDSQSVLDLARAMGLRSIGVRHDLNSGKKIDADFVINIR
jgi:beta-phosphoglucomutase-like phosphatase (HAD superfamily)